MFTRSHLQEMKRRYASIYAPPVEEKVIEDGTIKGVNQYKKDTPGQDIEKEFKEHCGFCGQGIKEDEVEESFELQATMALDDAGVKSKWKKGKLYVAKRDIKKAETALAKSFKRMKKGAEPDLYYEEVEIEEDASAEIKKLEDSIRDKQERIRDLHKHTSGDPDYYEIEDLKDSIKKKQKKVRELRAANAAKKRPGKSGPDLSKHRGLTGYRGESVEVEINEGLKDGQMVTLAQDPTVTGEYLMIPPAKAFPKTASDSIVGFKDKSLKKGKKVRVKIHNKKTYIELPKKVSVFVQVKDWEKNFQEEVEIEEAKGTAYPATVDTLRKIVKDKQHQTVMFKSGQALVDLFTASAIIAVYDGMKKPDLKKKLEDMIKTKEGFLRTQSFAMKMVK